MVEPYFKGIKPLKLVKRVVYLIVLEILEQIDMKISEGGCTFSVVFTCRPSEIRD